MENMSFDGQFCAMVRQQNHAPPAGLRAGVAQGVAGFGFSMLSALAGLVCIFSLSLGAYRLLKMGGQEVAGGSRPPRRENR